MPATAWTSRRPASPPAPRNCSSSRGAIRHRFGQAGCDTHPDVRIRPATVTEVTRRKAGPLLFQRQSSRNTKSIKGSKSMRSIHTAIATLLFGATTIAVAYAAATTTPVGDVEAVQEEAFGTPPAASREVKRRG